MLIVLIKRKMYSFGFEHVNEDQLMNVIKRVKRDKRRKRENEWMSYLSHKKENNFSELGSVDNILLKNEEELHNDRITRINLPIEVIQIEDGVNRRENISSSHVQRSKDFYFTSDRYYYAQAHALIFKIRNLRYNILRSLDTLLLQNEQDLLKEKLFKETLNKFKETENWRKLMNCQHRIQKLDYQLVMDMRKLSHLVTGEDTISLIKILCGCHSTASKLFQVFTHGWPDLLGLDTSKEKLYDLLKCMITLTRVCKFIGVNHTEIINLKDFLVNDINKRCKSIIHALKNSNSKEIQENYRRNTKTSTEFKKKDWDCTTYQTNKSTSIGIENIPKSTIYIPIKRFKKLAKQVFGAKERREKHIARNASFLHEDYDSIRRATTSYREKNKFEEKKKYQNSVLKVAKERCATSDSKEETKFDSDFNYVSVGTQHSSSFENKEIFDVESFSKKLYAALETEIHNNFHNIFRNLSFSQSHFQDCQIGDQNEGRHTFYNKNSINSLKKLKDLFQTTEIEELSLEKKNERNIKRQTEVVELDSESLKQNIELRALTNKQDTYIDLNETQQNEEKMQPVVKNHCLHLADEHSSFEKERNKTDLGKHELSGSNSSLVEHNKNNFSTLMENNIVHSGLEAKPWDIIGSISEKLISECLNSITCEVDNFIVQKMFDLEFN